MVTPLQDYKFVKKGWMNKGVRPLYSQENIPVALNIDDSAV